MYRNIPKCAPAITAGWIASIINQTTQLPEHDRCIASNIHNRQSQRN